MTIKYVNANWEEIAYSSSTTIDSNITTVYVRFVWNEFFSKIVAYWVEN